MLGHWPDPQSPAVDRDNITTTAVRGPPGRLGHIVLTTIIGTTAFDRALAKLVRRRRPLTVIVNWAHQLDLLQHGGGHRRRDVCLRRTDLFVLTKGPVDPQTPLVELHDAKLEHELHPRGVMSQPDAHEIVLGPAQGR